MDIIDRGTAFRAEPGSDLQSAAFPGACVMPGGRWLCVFRGAPAKNSSAQQTLLTCSDDEGQTWREPVAPWQAPHLNGKPGRFRGGYLTSLGGGGLVATLMWVDVTDPSLPFWHEDTETLLDTRIFLSRSQDAGESWSPPQYVDTYPVTLCVPATGPILLLHNGDWACQFELNKPYGSSDPAPWRHASMLAFSQDEGVSWPLFSVAGNDPENRFFFWDQRPGVLSDGTVLNVFWTLDNERAEYVNIQARESSDHGRTWSEMWDTGIPGQPANPVSLPDGRIAMPYVDRTAAPKIMLRCSSDGGRTWPDDTALTLCDSVVDSQTWKNKRAMKDQWAEMQQFSVGLPRTAALPDGDVLVAYYAGPQTDTTGIEWVRVRP